MDTQWNQNDVGSSNSSRETQLFREKPSFTAGPGLYIGVALTLFAVLLFFYSYCYPLHHDLAGSALSGRLAMSLGDTFGEYSIYFPPSEKFWFTSAARLSDLIGLRLDLTIVLMTGAVVLIGSGLAYWFRKTTVGASPFFFIGSVVVLTTLPILFKNVFGLREHLVAAGLWPYLVLRISDPDGTRVGWKPRAILGLWMGAMLLFKYLYSAVVFFIELADALLQRRFMLLVRIENLVAGLVVFFYLFLWLGIDPNQRAAIGAMLSAIDANLVDPQKNWFEVFSNLFVAAFLLITSRILQMPARTKVMGLAVVAGTVIAAWSQERWYTHHLFPIALAYIFWWWLAAKQFKWWTHLIMVLFVVLPIGSQFLSTNVYHKQLAEFEMALAKGRQSVAGKRVAILNMHPAPYNQYLVAHDATRWTPMMNNAYVSAELKSHDLPENANKLPPPVKLDDPGRKLLHDQMLRLWENMPPDVLILDRTSHWPLRFITVDWNRAFSNDRRFKAILSKYRQVQVYDGVRVRYTYYVRAN